MRVTCAPCSQARCTCLLRRAASCTRLTASVRSSHVSVAMSPSKPIIYSVPRPAGILHAVKERCDIDTVCRIASVQSDRCEPTGACVICGCHTLVMYQRVYLTHRWPLCLCATLVADRCDDRQTFDEVCAWSSGILSLRMRGSVVCTAGVC